MRGHVCRHLFIEFAPKICSPELQTTLSRFPYIQLHKYYLYHSENVNSIRPLQKSSISSNNVFLKYYCRTFSLSSPPFNLSPKKFLHNFNRPGFSVREQREWKKQIGINTAEKLLDVH
jgi:hypothetical protein